VNKLNSNVHHSQEWNQDFWGQSSELSGQQPLLCGQRRPTRRMTNLWPLAVVAGPTPDLKIANTRPREHKSNLDKLSLEDKII